jgi:hypothetical protein
VCLLVRRERVERLVHPQLGRGNHAGECICSPRSRSREVVAA